MPNYCKWLWPGYFMGMQMRISETACNKNLTLEIEDICNEMEFLNGLIIQRIFPYTGLWEYAL